MPYTIFGAFFSALGLAEKNHHFPNLLSIMYSFCKGYSNLKNSNSNVTIDRILPTL